MNPQCITAYPELNAGEAPPNRTQTSQSQKWWGYARRLRALSHITHWHQTATKLAPRSSQALTGSPQDLWSSLEAPIHYHIHGIRVLLYIYNISWWTTSNISILVSNLMQKSNGVTSFLYLAFEMHCADCKHDDVIKWKHFPPFVRGIHRGPVNSPH